MALTVLRPFVVQAGFLRTRAGSDTSSLLNKTLASSCHLIFKKYLNQ